ALDEIIARVNPLFVGELTEGDKLLCVDKAIKSILLGPGKLYELLRQQRPPSASDAQRRIARRSLAPWGPAGSLPLSFASMPRCCCSRSAAWARSAPTRATAVARASP